MFKKILIEQPKRLNDTVSRTLLNDIDNFLFDCDGVIWNWPNPIPGAIECINKLKTKHNKRCYFVTNNSTKTRKMYLEQLKKVGIENVNENDIVCTAWLLAAYLKSINFDKKVYIIGNASMGYELDQLNISHTGIGECYYKTIDDLKSAFVIDPDVKCVAVGFDFYFSYPKILMGTTYASQDDCLFLATNDDPVLPTGPQSRIVVPGTGTIVNAMRTSIVNKRPIILGKPYRTMFDILKRMHNLDENRTCMIGDRLDTDIVFGSKSQLKYTLAVFSGITNEEEILDIYDELKQQQTDGGDNNNNSLTTTETAGPLPIQSPYNRSALLPNFFCNSLLDLENLI